MRIFRKLAQLLDVDLVSTPPADGDALVYDDAEGKWVPGAGGGGGGSDDQTASEVPFTPAGTIAATNTQTAVEEVATDAASALSTHEADTTSVHGIANTANLYAAGGTDVAVADGGTGASTAAGARANLDLEPGTDFPALSTFNDHSGRHEDGGSDEIDLTGLSGTPAALTAHEADTTSVHGIADTSALALTANVQPLDSDLTAIAALTTTAFGRALLELANAGALLSAAGAQASDSDLTAIAGLSPSNDDIIQRKSGSWANRTPAQLIADLAALGTTFQPLDSDLTSIAALTTTSYGRGLLALAEFNAVLPYIKLSHTVSANTQGGASSSGSWQTRALNTEDTDTGSHCSLSSNQFTLSAGTYQCRGWTTIAGSAQAKVRIRNATGGSTLLVGNNEYAPGGAGVGTVCPVVVGQFTVAASQALELQYRVTNARATDGLGVAANWSENEVYAVVELWKVA